ncbi:unnamed protein product [Rotaria sp. Silwood1]|nr:unnamed protein product [Rotaria sp. Silwood1]
MRIVIVLVFAAVLPFSTLAQQYGTCTARNGLSGECISTKTCAANRGVSDPANLCPGDNSIQCCTYGTCKNSQGIAGICQPTSTCKGSSDPANLCPGGNNIQCCTTGGSSGAGGQSHHPPVLYGEACVTQGFHAGHLGVDIGSYGAKSVNLYAVWDGTVIGTCNGAKDYDRATCGDCGNYVQIRYNTVIVTYCHMKSGSLTVTNGQRVAKAQIVGKMGTSGQSTGVHLHVTVREISNNAAQDIRTRLGLNGWRNC